MTQNNGSEEGRKTPRFLKWLEDGISGAFSDSLKAVLIPIVTIFILSGIALFFVLNSTYIKIAFDLPAYSIAAGFLFSFLIVYANQRKIRKIFRRIKWRGAYGFQWKNSWKDELLGPCCCKCHAFVVETKVSYEKQMEGAFRMMQGVKIGHEYRCSNPRCQSAQITLDMDLHALIRKVKEEYYSME